MKLNFQNRRVLVTGHTGFKGAWLSLWLERLGANLAGLALEPRTERDVFALSGIGQRMRDYRADIRNLTAVLHIFAQEQPEVVFHLAAQPLVLPSYEDPVETFATNTQGTIHILEAIRRTPSVRAAVLITTDKCYENREWLYGYREIDPMGGHDPYSASKGAAELAIAAYRRSFFHRSGSPAVASARAGNVVGGGDWAEYRLVPDIIRAIESGLPLEVRNPNAIRPWQHVLEPLGGYLLLAQRLLEAPERYAEAWNFGPLPHSIQPVYAICNAFFDYFRQNTTQAKDHPGWREVSAPSQQHEASLLMLDISKALHRLLWRPVLTFSEMISLTADWYARYRTESVWSLCVEQIQTYEQLWTERCGQIFADRTTL
ncbi:MAG: CDP-glucose 4,6-dehydratase [Saprospiraceae bacterium]|nr:CDP-glucose 4,6-dehydratase [Saprospiraceae bacterium]MDW8485118.1 CDP-glucose 4,6-dehydratase [Saprospiraceae bacterium]